MRLPFVFGRRLAHTTLMLSQATLLGLIGRIYDAAADESLWPAFLEDLAGALDSAYYSTFDPYRSASLARLTRIGLSRSTLANS